MPPYRSMKIGVGDFCETMPVVPISHSDINGPMALLQSHTSLYVTQILIIVFAKLSLPVLHILAANLNDNLKIVHLLRAIPLPAPPFLVLVT